MEEVLPADERPTRRPQSFELSTADLDAADLYDSIDSPMLHADTPLEPAGVHLGGGGPAPLPLAEARQKVVPRPDHRSPLDALPAAVVDALREGAERRRYEAGARIAIAAARFDGVRLVDVGRVSVTLPRQATDSQVATRDAGDLVGVVELVRGGTRWTQNATATGAVEVLHLDTEQVADVRRQHPAWAASLDDLARRRLASGLLAGSRLFSTLGAAERAQLAADLEVRFLQDREALIEPGERPDGVFLLAEGRLEVSRDGVHVGGLSPGDCVGLVSALDNVAGEALVSAAPVAEVFCLRGEALAELLQRPDVRAAFERAVQMRRLLVSRR